METTSDMVMQYEDEQLQSCGKKIIPIERLTENAMNKLRLIQKEIISKKGSNNPELCLRDLILCELARWFNDEFFTWVNSLPCKKCGNEDVPTKGSYVENGIRVEVCSVLISIKLTKSNNASNFPDIYMLQRNIEILSFQRRCSIAEKS